MLARHAGRVSIDLGTGDGRLPEVRARQAPERLFIGIDANAAGLRERSGRATRNGANVVFVRAAVEALPSELAGVADQLTAILPWGSLLAALATPSVAMLSGIRALCRSDARLTIVIGVDPARDRSELQRLGLPALDLGHVRGAAGSYAEAGFSLRSVRPIGPRQLAEWPSTWARRLAHGRERTAFEIEARAVG